MILNSHKLFSIFNLLAWVILGTYCFVAFLPMPWGIGIGLDPSWQYALSRAADDKLIFGQDIIFTYGPLGYLVTGAVRNQNFLSILVFRFLVHVVLFGVAFAKIVSLKTNLQKISLALSLLFPYLIYLSTDYMLLFVFIILLSSNIFDSQRANLVFLVLGGVSGFCLLTKFTLGIYTLGSLFLLCLVNLYSSIKARSRIVYSIGHLVSLVVSATTIAFIFLNPNRISSIKQILTCLIIAGVIEFSLRLSKKRFEHRDISKVIGIHEQRVKVKALDWLMASWRGFYAAYCISLLITVFYTFPSLINYLKSSLEISSGYSSAMSLTGSAWELGLAISEIILIVILLTKIASRKYLGFCLSLTFILWISFKQGFVRQDYAHVLIFLLSTPLIVSLCIAKSKTNSTLKFAFLIHIYVLAIALGYCFFSTPYGSAAFQSLNYVNVFNETSALLNIKKTSNTLDATSLVNLNNVKLPEMVVNLLRNKRIDIFPWEISLVEANKLNWRPRPIFQSYAAYTSFLDHKNSESIIREPREYIIYQFTSIDGRHPFFDEPETFFNVLCKYGPSTDIPNFVNTPGLANLLILEKRKLSMCSSGTVDKMLSMPWNKSQTVEANDRFLIRAAVDIEYSGFGKFYKTLFRSPPVKININYTDGSANSYRIIPENSHNGVIISHLPQNDEQALSLFQGQLYNPVKSFSFSTKNSLLYKPNINVTFTSYEILEPAVKKPLLLIDISQLKFVRFLPAKLDEYIGVMDTQQQSEDKSFEREDVISTSGWATRKLSKGEKCWVLLTYGEDNKPLAIAQTGMPRPDVAKYFNKSEYTKSGWSINFNSERMPEGVHDIKAWIYDPTSNSATSLNGVYRIQIR